MDIRRFPFFFLFSCSQDTLFILRVLTDRFDEFVAFVDVVETIECDHWVAGCGVRWFEDLLMYSRWCTTSYTSQYLASGLHLSATNNNVCSFHLRENGLVTSRGILRYHTMFPLFFFLFSLIIGDTSRWFDFHWYRFSIFCLRHVGWWICLLKKLYFEVCPSEIRHFFSYHFENTNILYYSETL